MTFLGEIYHITSRNNSAKMLVSRSKDVGDKNLSNQKPKKLRKFTDKTNIQARNHENSDEFRPAPRSSHPAFYHYRKNPKC